MVNTSTVFFDGVRLGFLIDSRNGYFVKGNPRSIQAGGMMTPKK